MSWLRRTIDIAGASAGLLLAGPIMLATAAVIKTTSAGPAMFRQVRVGKNGTKFRIHKFRTMQLSHDGIAVSATGDPRITKVGVWLRKTKLDELPQLIDILNGSMSFVGPRPEVPQYAERWPNELKSIILSVRPGITDPVTLELRSESDLLAEQSDPVRYYTDVLLPHKARCYAHYVENRSLANDLGVIVKTVIAVLTSSKSDN